MGVHKPFQGILNSLEKINTQLSFRLVGIFVQKVLLEYMVIQYGLTFGAFLFEPEFKIGTRQIFREPTCERRILLQVGNKKIHNQTDTPLGVFCWKYGR